MTVSKWFAVDCTTAAETEEPFGAAWFTDLGGGYSDDWAEWRRWAVSHAAEGYTMVLHGAESGVTRLLYPRREYVQCHYRDGEYSSAEWHYDPTVQPMQIWDSMSLAGGQSLPTLVTKTVGDLYPTPQRYTWRYLARWRQPCFGHGTARCPLCYGLVDRVSWRCKRHDTPECPECWRVQRAEAVYRFMVEYSLLADRYGVKPTKTIGGLALTIWRRIDEPPPIRLRSKAMEEAARRGYFGARAEATKLGHTGAVVYGDVEKMYGSVMADIRLPTPESTLLNDGAGNTGQWLMYPGMSDCTVTVPDCYVPPLPFRRGGRLLFPVGEFRGWFSHDELRLAIDHGATVRHWHASLYGTETTKPIEYFALALMDYIPHLAKHGMVTEETAKRVLNALYGCIGMRQGCQTCYVLPLPPGTTPSDWPYHEVKVLRDHILMRRESWQSRRSKWSNPLWAALITAAARVKLYNLLVMHGGELAYTDTDSVITMGELRGESEGPGGLHYKGTFTDSWIVGPKLYRLEHPTGNVRLAHSGIPRWQLDRLLEHGQAERGETVGVLEGFFTGLEPGRYVRYNVGRRYEIGQRQPLDLAALSDPDGWTDTRPVVLMGDSLTIDGPL